MMYPLTLVLIFSAGWSLTGLMQVTANRIERSGLAVLCGYGLITLLMFSLHLIGLPIAPYVYLPALALFSADGARRLVIARRHAVRRGFESPAPDREPTLRELLSASHPSMAIAGAIIFLIILLIVILRCLYLPNASYDSLAGFDLLGKVIAAEQEFRVSLFDYAGIARRGTYPPFTALSLAWGYQTGLTSSMSMMIAPLLGFLAWIFGFARRYVGGTSALGLLVAVMIAPDFYAWCHQPVTQFPVMAFYASTVFYISAALWERRAGELIPATVTALFLVWSRPDSFVFVVGGSVALLLFARRAKLGLRSALLPLPAAALFALWQLYSAHTLGQGGITRMILTPYWDAARIQLIVSDGLRLLFAPSSMGYAGYFFFAALGSCAFARRREAVAAPLVLSVSLFLYWLLFYQTDPVSQDPLPVLMQSSYRRGLTAFVLPFWFVWMVSPAGVWSRRILGNLFARRTQ